MKHKNKTKRNIAWVTLILLLANIVFFLTVWLMTEYEKVLLDQFIYQLKSPVTGAENSIVGNGFLYMGGFAFSLTAIETLLFLLLTGRLSKVFKFKKYLSYTKTKFCQALKKTALPISLACLILSASFFVVKMDIVGYAAAAMKKSDFIEKNYVNPNDVEIRFPENKRNLVFIFLESMENTYASKEEGGQFADNLIPEL
ncbi:MAG: hypothetical protein ACOYJS_05565, partial [Acutalibacteraceae bacterium]